MDEPETINANNAIHRTPTRVTLHAWSLRSRHGSRHGQVSVIADVRQKIMPHEKTTDILNNLESFHAEYYDADTFRGPSLYFHLRALDSRNNCDAFAEMSYSMLASWGMHRMGPGGSKMKYFDSYKASLNQLWPAMQTAAQFNIAEMNDEGWKHLKRIFCGLDVMASGTSLVGNSKVMAHAFPHLIAPIDRQYTLNYLFGNGTIQNDKDGEWEKLKDIMTTFFYPIVLDPNFTAKLADWATKDFPWDTSPLKVVDNLVIGAVKKQDKANKAVDSTATRVTTPVDPSLRSGQESRHGQPCVTLDVRKKI